MPVVVIGASGFVGRHAVAAFAGISPEVRAYVRRREAAEELRALGAKVAVGSLEDVDTLATVMDGAHTVCHLVRSRSAPSEEALEASILTPLRPVLKAAVAAGVKRVLYLSHPHASPASANAVLRLTGLAEEAIRSSGLEHAIVRSTWIYGPGSPWLDDILRRSRRRALGVAGTGRQLWAPVYVEDVTAVLVGADDRGPLRSGVLGLEGPDRVTADEFYRMVAGRRARTHHASVRFAPRSSRRGWTIRSLAEMAASDSLADESPDAATEFGVERTALEDGLRRWRASLER
jgi:NADH dehydrogenase